jgi:hypothetical protein
VTASQLGTVTIAFTESNSITTTYTISNTATISYDGGTPVPSNTVTVTWVPPIITRPSVTPPSFIVTKSVDGGSSLTITGVPVAPPGGFSFGVAVSAEGVVGGPIAVVDPLPSYPGLTFGTPMISNVSSELTSSGCFISGSTPGMGGGTVTCTLLPSGSSATYLSYTPIADVTVPFQLAAKKKKLKKMKKRVNIKKK